MPRRPLAALLLLASLLAALACGSRPPDLRRYERLAGALDSLDDIDTLAVLRDSLLAFQPGAQAGRFVGLLSDIAERALAGGIGDPYAFLRRGAGLLDSLGLAEPALRARLAAAFLDIGLPWRARAVLQPVAGSPDSAVTALQRAVDEAMTGLPGDPTAALVLVAALESAPALSPIFAPWVDPDTEQQSAPLIRVPESERRDPFLIPGAAPAEPPWAEFGGLNGDVAPLDPPGQVRAAWRRLGHEPGDAPAPVRDPAVLRYVRTLGVGLGDAIRVRAGGWLAVMAPQMAESEFLTIVENTHVVLGRADGTGPYTHFRYAEGVSATLLDVSGDGTPELVVQMVEGSGGFLSVAVLDVRDGHALFEASGVPKGSALFLNLDPDPALELLVLFRDDEADGTGPFTCNQCPAPYVAVRYDLDRAARRYRALKTKRTIGYYSIQSGWTFGLGPHMQLFLIESEALDALARLRSSAANGTPVPENDALLVLGEFHQTALGARQAERSAAMMGDARQALAAGAIVEGGHRDALLSLAAFNEAEALIQLRRFPEAMAVLRDSLVVHAAEGDTTLEGERLNRLSVAAMYGGAPGAAYDAIVGQIAAGGSLNARAVAAGNLAWYLLTVERPAEAEDAAARALDLAVVAGNYGGAAIDLIHLANAALRRGDVETAVDQATRAMRLTRESGGTLPTIALALAADIAARTDDPSAALTLLDEAIVTVDLGAWGSVGASLLLGYAGVLQQLGRSAEAAALLQVAAETPSGGDPSTRIVALRTQADLALAAGDSGGALRLGRQAFEGILGARRSINPELHKFSFLASQRGVSAWYLDLARRGGTATEVLFRDVERFKLQVFRDVFEARGPGDTALELEAARQGLAPGDLLLDYVLDPAGSWVLVVPRDGPAEVRDLPVTVARVDSLRRVVRRGLDVRDPGTLAAIRRDRLPADVAEALAALDREVLAPATRGLSPARVIIVPDEGLYGIPWAALRGADGGYAVDRYELVVAPSVSLAFRSAGDRGAGVDAGRPAVVLASSGGVSSAAVTKALGWDVGVRSLAPLRFVTREVEAVAKYGRGGAVQVVTDSAAARGLASGLGDVVDPQDAFRAMEGASLIHVVAHGLFNPRAPMRSVVFLGDRVLQASDFAGLDLRGVGLVALTACQTAVSAPAAGAEPIGFVRGILGAGAASVLLTEWEVDDEQTAALVAEFYTRLRNARVSLALREAQQAIRRRREHPYYWAGFTLFGRGG